MKTPVFIEFGASKTCAEVYHFRFNGMENDDEVAGTGNIMTAEFWMYDGRLGRRWNVDSKPNPSFSIYQCFGNNPIWNIDPLGDTARITTSSGKYLFSLDDGKTEIRTMTARDLYKEGIQWFEPLADNYMELLDVNKDITSMPELKHFTWDQIAAFAEVDRWMYSYRQGGSGDWKSVKEGGDGFLLVTVNGKPYWADAVGQIAFAVDYFTDDLAKTGGYVTSLNNTIKKGMEYGEGEIFGGTEDNSNTYDNYFLLRGALFAGQRYIASKPNSSSDNNLTKTNYSSNNLGRSISKKFKDKYLSNLNTNQSATK